MRKVSHTDILIFFVAAFLKQISLMFMVFQTADGCMFSIFNIVFEELKMLDALGFPHILRGQNRFRKYWSWRRSVSLQSPETERSSIWISKFEVLFKALASMRKNFTRGFTKIIKFYQLTPKWKLYHFHFNSDYYSYNCFCKYPLIHVQTSIQ